MSLLSSKFLSQLPISFQIKASVLTMACKVVYNLPPSISLTLFQPQWPTCYSLNTLTLFPSQSLAGIIPQISLWLSPSSFIFSPSSLLDLCSNATFLVKISQFLNALFSILIETVPGSKYIFKECSLNAHIEKWLPKLEIRPEDKCTEPWYFLSNKCST